MKQIYTKPDVLLIYPGEEDILTISTINDATGGESAKWGSEIFF